MEKRIVVEQGVLDKIAKAMGCTTGAVCMALRYKRDSMLARRIRQVAVKEYEGVALPLEKEKSNN
jgi:hypothetical protein